MPAQSKAPNHWYRLNCQKETGNQMVWLGINSLPPVHIHFSGLADFWSFTSPLGSFCLPAILERSISTYLFTVLTPQVSSPNNSFKLEYSERETSWRNAGKQKLLKGILVLFISLEQQNNMYWKLKIENNEHYLIRGLKRQKFQKMLKVLILT